MGLLLAAIAAIFFIYHRASLHRQAIDARDEAMRNMRAISIMLFEFDNEYGSYPSAKTAADVKAATDRKLSFGDTSSNQLFRQLLAGGAGKSEKPFWAAITSPPRKPDDHFTGDSTALAKGECGFAYIAGLSTSSDPSTPLLMTPLLPGKREFDPKPFHGYAVILFNDNNASVFPIQKDGKVILNGMDIFDPKQPFWHGKAPDIKWPE
ncbi:hypothetical protein [Haloferula sp. BvORR071]|uniref:hypothetical protein n=1 Tax=Haloferula sp. BvORR071 TaxID=1396141 RepID=UPI000558FD62|nr:hypothetical protein [Haloferula sp. BvORR071]